jgi:hypothetical protein
VKTNSGVSSSDHPKKPHSHCKVSKRSLHFEPKTAMNSSHCHQRQRYLEDSPANRFYESHIRHRLSRCTATNVLMQLNTKSHSRTPYRLTSPLYHNLPTAVRSTNDNLPTAVSEANYDSRIQRTPHTLHVILNLTANVHMNNCRIRTSMREGALTYKLITNR